MVAFGGFFGGGVVEQVNKDRALGQRDRSLDIDSERLTLFKQQLKQKANSARITNAIKQADTFEDQGSKLLEVIRLRPELGTPGVRQVANKRNEKPPGLTCLGV